MSQQLAETQLAQSQPAELGQNPPAEGELQSDRIQEDMSQVLMF